MNPALSTIDRGISYFKNTIVSCDGEIQYSLDSHKMIWTDQIDIFFNRSLGQATRNIMAAGSIELFEDSFCYIDLSETDDDTITPSVAFFSLGAASTIMGYSRLILSWRELNNFFSPWFNVNPDKQVQQI
jgi:hypothetical protein